MEIERRFLVKDIEKIKELMLDYNDTKVTIIQDYIYSDIFTAIRKRKIIKGENEKYVYTIKTGRKGISVNEIENEITKDQYESIKEDENRIKIEKDRYFIPYIDELVIELDIFHGEYEGVVFAEIEYKDEEQAFNTEIPDWFYMEIGGKISNDKMSRKKIDIDSL